MRGQIDKAFNKRQQRLNSSHQGFVLPVVIVIGFVLMIGGLSQMSRGFAHLIAARRQGSSETAKAVADSGMAIILKTLNIEYPYLLTTDCELKLNLEAPDELKDIPICEEWHEEDQDLTAQSFGSFNFRTSTCPGRTHPPSTIFRKLSQNTPNQTGHFQLISYRFTGDANQGGVASIKVKGVDKTHKKIQGISYLQQEVNIVPKNCNLHSGFPGILGEAVLLHKADVDGEDELDINGNVLCLDCPAHSTKDELAEQMGVDKASNLFDNRDKLFGGIIAMPKVPTFPDQAIAKEAEINETNSARLLIDLHDQGSCWLDEEKLITHCKIANITLSGSDELVMNTKALHCKEFGQDSDQCKKNGHVRLYVSGDITLSGQSRIINVDCDDVTLSACQDETLLHPADMGIFGPPNTDTTETDPFDDSACNGRQDVVLNGSAQGGTNAFIFMPDACVRVNGGSGRPDFHGAVWSYKFEPSNSLNIDVQVPDDMGNRLYRLFGSDFALAIREFSARGVNRWSQVQP